MSEEQDLNAIWEQAKETILEEMPDFNRSLWDAANAARPLALEGDSFVLGVPPGQMALGSHLTSTANGPMVRQAVAKALGRPVTVELVEGTDETAWEQEKGRREARERLAERQQQASRATASLRALWAELYEEVARIFGAVRERRFPTTRARMLAEALLATRDTEARAREEAPDSEDFHQQQLNRIIDRIASLSELPPTMVAVEYLRVKSMSKGRD